MNISNERWIRDVVVEILGEEPATISDGENLFEAGLDSVGLLRLVNRLRRGGLQVSFGDLAREPTLAAWDRLVGSEKAADDGAEPASGHTADAPDEGGANSEPTQLGVMQHAYWVGRSAGQRLGGVAAHLYAEFDHPPTGTDPAIDANRLKAALERVLERHETLRTRITSDGRQEVLAKLSALLAVHDMRGHSEAEVQDHLSRMRDAFSHQALDIDNGEVMSVALTLLPDGATRLHLDVDMIAADAVSYRILLADFAALYGSPSLNLPPLGLNYRDYLAGTRSGHAQRVHQAAEAWRERLPTLPGAPILPEVIEATSRDATPRVARRHLWLAPGQKQQLTEIARRNGVTVAMTVATVLSEVVGHWSTTDHFLLNVPMFDRAANHPDIDRIVGDFSSSVMLEVDLRQPLTFVDRVRALQARMHADAAHASHTGLDVLRDLGRQRGETVLAPVVFTSALGLGELFAPAVTAVVGRPVWVISQGPQVLLDAQVTEFEDGLLVNWDTREDALAPGVVDAMFTAFEQVLREVIDEPAAWNRPIRISTANAQRRRSGDRDVRIVDAAGCDRPDHVAGRLLFAGEDEQGRRPWGRADESGGVRLLGDDDERVDVHGIPVWPVEVEDAIRSDGRIGEVAVVRHDESLVAVVAFEPSTEADTRMTGKAFRAQLARRIPSHLLPSRIIVVDRLPRNADGGANSDALDRLISAKSERSDHVAPRTDLERVLAGAWEEILGLENIGVNEEFIALGGDSLLAARVVSRLREELDTNAVTLRALFRSPTIAELAEQLRKDGDPARLDEVASIVLEIRAMSDDEVASHLGETASDTSSRQSGTAA
ncbi:condensation domain-containing protein [Rhizobium tumorigenes]|uniref:L-cysteine--[L-cysteinyl-carrier protein] ligase n=1 Tax=Rhizobium tumorigenes TaxID=2041385 RepID=A0AAF1KS61_9HYPH|nr:condensation domain-containing protein [Rhizobium tumorigenes]WFR97527.1 condensation domain-containing protein [Rhizobium tumorigenes]